MNNYISLLRGINVSGQKLIKMADLRALYESLGFTDVQSYIQSGNVLFTSSENDEAALAEKILNKIKKEYGYEVSIFITSKKALKKVIAKNPFLKRPGIDIRKLAVTFLSEKPDKALVKILNEYQDPIDEFIVDSQYLYLHCPNGSARTKLTLKFFERKLNVAGTSRNWRTVNKLFDMAVG